MAAIEVLDISADGFLVHLGNGYAPQDLVTKTAHADLSAIGGFTWQKDDTNKLWPIDWAQGVWSPPQADIQTITIGSTDDFDLFYGPADTGWLHYNVSLADLQAAIRGLSSETANSIVTGTPGTSYTITTPAANMSQVFATNTGGPTVDHTQIGNARFDPDVGTNKNANQSPWDEVAQWMTWDYYKVHRGLNVTLLSLVWWKETESGISNMGARTGLMGDDLSSSNIIALFQTQAGYGSPFPAAGSDTLKVMLGKWTPFYWFPEIETNLNRISVPTYTVGGETLGGFDVLQTTVIRKDLDPTSEASFYAAYIPYFAWANPWFGVTGAGDQAQYPCIATAGYYPWFTSDLNPDDAPNYYPMLYDYRWTGVPRLRKSIGTIEAPGNYDCLLSGSFWLNTASPSASGTITLGLGIPGAYYTFGTDQQYFINNDEHSLNYGKIDYKVNYPYDFNLQNIWTDSPPCSPEKIDFSQWREPGDDAIVVRVRHNAQDLTTPFVVGVPTQGVPLSISSDVEVLSHIEVANKNVPRDWSWTSFPDYGTITEVSPGCGGANPYSEFVFRGITSSCIKITISGVVRGSTCQSVSPGYDPRSSRNGNTILGSIGPGGWKKSFRYPNCWDGTWHDIEAYLHNLSDSAGGCVLMNGDISGSGTGARFYGAEVSLGADPVMVDRDGLDPIASTHLFNVTLSVAITAAGGATWKKVVASNQIPQPYQESAPYTDTNWHQRSMTYIGTDIDVTFTNADLISTTDQADYPDDYGNATIRVQSENAQDPPTGGESVWLCAIIDAAYPKTYSCSEGAEDHFVEVSFAGDGFSGSFLCEKDLLESTWSATVYKLIFDEPIELTFGDPINTSGTVYGIKVTLCDYSYATDMINTPSESYGGKIEFIGPMIYCWVNNPWVPTGTVHTIGPCVGEYLLGGYEAGSGDNPITMAWDPSTIDTTVAVNWRNVQATIAGFIGSGE